MKGATSQPAKPLSAAVGDAAANRPAGWIEVDLVRVAPAPILARLERPDDRVVHAVEMGGGVSVRRAVTAAHMAAGHAQPQVHPTSPDLEAVLAAVGAGGDGADLVEMLANRHRQKS